MYRISLNTADAKREAANIRSTFEKELRQIKTGDINFSTATGQAKQLSAELGNVAEKGKQVASSLPTGTDAFSAGVEGAISQLKGLATAYIGLQAVTSAIDLSRLGTQANRTFASLNILSGGGEKTAAVLQAIQKASNGTVSELEAAGIATQGFALKLARTPAEFEKLTRAAREIVQVSPGINNVGDALGQLSLFAANEASFARADQLGLAASEVKDRIKELQAADDSLSGSQAKLIASMQLLDEKFGATLNTAEAQASGIEKLRVAWEDFKVAVATANTGVASEFFSIDKPASNVATILRVISGDYSKIQAVTDAVGRSVQLLENRKNSYFFPEDTTSQIEEAKQRLDAYSKAYEQVAKATASGVPGADKYQMALDEISKFTSTSGVFTDEQIKTLQELDKWYQDAALSAVSLAEAEKLRSENKISADQLEQTRQGTIMEQQPGIDQALASAAAKVAPTAGIEAAIATYRQQKALVDQAIQQLIDSGVSDQGEIAIRVAGIVDALTQPFDALEERATTVDFSAIGSAFTGLNQSFVDFLPGIASARDELATLSEELAYTGTMSAEQAAQFEYLSSVAYAVADGGSQLNGVVNELGTQFLSSNAYAAELVNQLFLAEAAFRNGQISAGTYAGMTAALTGNLLTLAQGAGIATSAIWQLNQAQADMSNLPGYGAGQQVGGSISDRIATQQAASGREQNRREMERYNAAVARQQESSAKRAGKALEDGAKKASQELKSALDKVPGLFSTTDVTEKDMQAAKDGTYTDKADEKLRRLRDEVKNGVDWADVSIEDAKSSIEKLGITAANTKEGILAQFEDLWNSQALWADMSNIEQWIDKGAVEQQMMLQQKSEEGRNNIYKFFGVQIDEATSAATGGGGAAPAPVAPPKLVDIDPLTEGLQTGLDEYVNANGEVIKEQVAQAQALFFDPANLFGTGGAPGGKNAGTMGPAQKPGAAIVTADATLQALTPYITGQQQATIQMQATGAAFGPQSQGTAPTSGAVTLTPTLDAATLQAELAKLTLTITPAFLVAEVEKQNIISAVGAIVPTVNVALAVSAEAGTMTTLVQSINTELRTIQPDIRREGATAAQMLAAGLTTALGGADAPVDVSTPLITALTANVAASAPLFATPGTMVAQIIMAAILANMQGQQGQGGGEGGGGPIAAALVTNMITQFATATPQFMAAGVVPAQIVEAGFKSHPYTGMADNLQASINQSVGAKAAEFIQVGGYIGGWIQQGINQAFTAEVNLSFAVNAGASWGTAFMKGALSAVGGGTLVQAISDKVVTDLATELEK